MLGDEDDEEPPPGYDDAVIASGSETGSRKGSVASGEMGGASMTTDEVEIVEEPLRHRIQKGETIRSIANRYAMDVSALFLPPSPSVLTSVSIAVYLNQTQRTTIYGAHHASNSYPDEAMDHIGTFFPPQRGTAAVGTVGRRGEQMGRDRGR